MDFKIKNFFYPKSICIAGASSKEKSIGYELVRSIKNFGYTGKVYPINPKADSILGYKCYKKIEDVADQIDLAIVVVPKIFVEETVTETLNKKIKSIILVTAGFKEVSKEGEAVEQKILAKVKNAGAKMVGPNCMGVITTFEDVKLNATFVAEKPEMGKTAFLSQSGAIGAAVLNSLRETDIKFGHFISVGNKADISENDLLQFWQEDDNIQTLTFYLESFVDGESFLKYFIEGRITKPVIVLKAGRTKAGMKAASSHTGALGSSDKVVDAVLDQFGIIRAETLTELFNTSKGFENFPKPMGNRIAVVTNAGGPAILAVDSLEKNNLQLAKFSDEPKRKLREIVHPEGSVENPVDLLPGGTAEQFKIVNEIISEDENVDAVISIFVEPVMVPAFEVIENVNSIESNKPIFQVVMPLPEFWENYRHNSKFMKPLFRNPEDPAKVISNILFYHKKSGRKNCLIPKTNQNRFADEIGFISNQSIQSLAEEYNFPVIGSHLINENQLNKIAEEFNYPVVLKGISKEVVHKSELDTVKLNIKNAHDLLIAAKYVSKIFKQNKISLEQFLIQPFIKAKHEILIGGFRDNSFGPMIMFGSGGKYVEVYDDTCLKSAYLNDDDVEEIISGSKIGRILNGVRGEKSVDLQKIKNLIKSSAQMMLDNQRISEFDFNPVIITEDESLFIVDARIKLAD
ncbi:MAG: acetate--CoA ligase family protein [Bacteroidetes bacterium]|nr:acetate--CoA ligase family protein [Bacteroidota bacterium]